MTDKFFDSHDLVSLQAAERAFGFQVGDTMMVTHGPLQCRGEDCCIHNPSDHPLRNARLNWRGDRAMMERICQHNVGHPDPDDLAYKRRIMGPNYRRYPFEDHSCDGCCTTAPRPEECCGKCPPILGGGYDCTCKGNPNCSKNKTSKG